MRRDPWVVVAWCCRNVAYDTALVLLIVRMAHSGVGRYVSELVLMRHLRVHFVVWLGMHRVHGVVDEYGWSHQWLIRNVQLVLLRRSIVEEVEAIVRLVHYTMTIVYSTIQWGRSHIEERSCGGAIRWNCCSVVESRERLIVGWCWWDGKSVWGSWWSPSTIRMRRISLTRWCRCTRYVRLRDWTRSTTIQPSMIYILQLITPSRCEEMCFFVK